MFEKCAVEDKTRNKASHESDDSTDSSYHTVNRLLALNKGT